MHHAIAKLNVLAKAILVALCVAIGLSNTYIPLPIAIEKDLSTPFPCQAKGCGCANAHQCWSQCCCHSDAEKLAWAKQNNVAPPAWFLEKVKFTSSSQATKQSKCCCSQKEPKAIKAKSSAPKSCCESGSDSCCCSTQARKKSSSSCCCQSGAKSCCSDAKSNCKPNPHPTRTVLMTLKEQRGCHGADDGLADLNLKLIPVDIEPDSNSAHSEALCCMELGFVSFWPSPPEPIPE